MASLSFLVGLLIISAVNAYPLRLLKPVKPLLTRQCLHQTAPIDSLNSTSSASGISSDSLVLGLKQLEPFIRIAVPFFKEDKKARESLISVLALTLLNSGVSVAFSYVVRDFYNALNARDQPVFYEKIELYFALLVVAVPVAVYYRFTKDKLALYWRENLTKRVLDSYFTENTFYVMETSKSIDNPGKVRLL